VRTFVDEIFDLFARFGGEAYGERLSLERHMLQTATMARSLGASDHLVAAALLHDIGYFLDPESATMLREGRDMDHETRGAVWLAQGYDERVTAPVALHVKAKRYLCAVEPAYWDGLSDASKRTLAAQGGPFDATEVSRFEQHKAFRDAVLLRRCDDGGKDVAGQTESLEGFGGVLEATLR
jgi:gamma-butyrobetaine dioxygenase